MIRAAFLCLLLAGATAAAAQTLPPVDQCAADASFSSFRSALLQAIERRDAAFVLSVLADDVSVDFGGGAGRDDFRRAWALDRPEASALWSELGAVLRLGCVADGGTFWAPSMFRQLEHLDDPTGVVVAIGPDAVLRAAPSDTSREVVRLDWDVLVWRSVDSPEDWMPVALADGRTGFVRRDRVRSMLDHRASFAKVDGRWRITAFIAGD